MSEENLKKRITELEKELYEKDQDLLRFQQELLSTNAVLKDLIQQTEVQLKIASLIQKKMTPTEFPHINGVEFSTKFIPGLEKGGDYYDIFEHEDKFRFGMILASGSGYSMSALLLSVLLKLTGQMEARKGKDPHLVVEAILAEMLPLMTERDNASLFYATIDRRSYEMKYCLLGEISFLHWNHSQNKLITLDPTATKIHKKFSDNLETCSLHLNPRDRIILATEGMIEAFNQELFGKERLYRAIIKSAKEGGVHGVRNEVLYKLDEFLDRHPPHRDVTLLVSEIKDKVIKLAKI